MDDHVDLDLVGTSGHTGVHEMNIDNIHRSPTVPDHV